MHAKLCCLFRFLLGLILDGTHLLVVLACLLKHWERMSNVFFSCYEETHFMWLSFWPSFYLHAGTKRIKISTTLVHVCVCVYCKARGASCAIHPFYFLAKRGNEPRLMACFAPL